MDMDIVVIWLLRLSVLIAFCVITLGAYVRLTDAGLGCPDWPGCYGKILVPSDQQAISEANQAFPERPVEQTKAWREMAHRYMASLLGLLILVIATLTMTNKLFSKSLQSLSIGLLVLVVAQGLLGMWTVTLLLKPIVVVAHLLGGMTILSLLLWFALRSQLIVSRQQNYFYPINIATTKNIIHLKIMVIIATIILAVQIALGGWVAANYAALACPDFPACQGQWLPPVDFKSGFTLWHGIEVDYEGGILAGEARTAIHLSHRFWAVLVILSVFGVCFLAWQSAYKVLKTQSICIMSLLCLQVCLGIMNIWLHLPLMVAVAHNAIATLLLVNLIVLFNQLTAQQALKQAIYQ